VDWSTGDELEGKRHVPHDSRLLARIGCGSFAYVLLVLFPFPFLLCSSVDT
jgi:hypothetical protein